MTALVVLGMGAITAHTQAAVDLVLRPVTQTVDVGQPVEVGLFAVSDDGTPQTFSGLDVVLTWDAVSLELAGVDRRAPGDWGFIFGFSSDVFLDGLNADCGQDAFCEPYTGQPFNDGDALFQAASISEVTADVDGLLVATFRFNSLLPAQVAGVVVQPTLGDRSITQVLRPGAVDVTGSLQDASVTIIGAILSTHDFTMAAGGISELTVFGEIENLDTLGVVVLLELTPRAGATGSVTFTPVAAPEDVDIFSLADPWDGQGTVQPFDTDLTGSELRNGVILDNRTFLAEPLTYSGPLAAFPIRADPGATGVWDVRLCIDSCTGTQVSSWEAEAFVPTALLRGSVTLVAPGDGDGNGEVVMRDFAEFQRCFTGSAESADRPVYSLSPELRCGVYNFDGDHDVDADDFGQLKAILSSPGK